MSTWQDKNMIGRVKLMEAVPYTCWILLLYNENLVQVHGFTNGNNPQNAENTTKSSAVSPSPMDMGLWIALGIAGTIILILAVVILSIILRRRVCQVKSDTEDIISPEEVPTSIDRKPSADNVYDELPEDEDTGHQPVLPPSEERPPSYGTATRAQTDNTADIDPDKSEINANEFPSGQGDITDVSRHSSYDNIPGMGLEAYADVDKNDKVSSRTEAGDNEDGNNATPPVDPVYAIIDEPEKEGNRDSRISGTIEVEPGEDGIQPPSFTNNAPSMSELAKLDGGSTDVYAVIDKAKKKKKRDSETSGTIEMEEGEDGIQPPSFTNNIFRIAESSKLDGGLTDVYAVIDKTKKKKNRERETRGLTILGEEENGILPSSIAQSGFSLTNSSRLPVGEGSGDVYAVIDKIKKKSNRESEISGTSEVGEGENGTHSTASKNSTAPLTESSKLNGGANGVVAEKHSRVRLLIDSFASS